MSPAQSQTEEEILEECKNNFYVTATIQGRLAYLFMSIHAVNPYIIGSITQYNPTHILRSNMIYGVAVHIFSREHMHSIGLLHRLTFSIFGSLMFNHGSLLVYQWLKERLSHRMYLLTFLGFLSGRIMMVHLLAYLYHVDTRTSGNSRNNNMDRNSAYDTMYI